MNNSQETPNLWLNKEKAESEIKLSNLNSSNLMIWIASAVKVF